MTPCGRSIAPLLALVALAASACGSAARQSPSVTLTPTSTLDRVAALKTSVALGTPFPTMPPLPPHTRFVVSDMSFIDSRRGWVLRANDVATQVLFTSDAGETWAVQYSGSFTGYRVDFVDAQHGWVVGSDACTMTPGPDCRGVLLSTRDGGATWMRATPVTERLTDESFVSPEDGWVLAVPGCYNCSAAHLLRTHDGGASWLSDTLPDGQYPYGQSGMRTLFRFGNTGVIARRRDIIVSQDGGATWSTRENGCGEREFLYLAWFIDPSHGWSVCGDGRAGGTIVEKFVYATVDGGVTWALRSQNLFGSGTPPAGVGSAPASSVYDLEFATASDGWMSTSFGLYWTGDGGTTWAARAESGGTVGDLFFLDSASGFARMGDTGFGVTEDGGVTWRARSLPP